MSEDGFLGVTRSLSGLRWRARGGDDRAGIAIAQRLGVPELIGRVMASRGIALEAAERFLAPTLRDMLPDPASFKDMNTAVARLVAAVRGGETIAIFGDYDVDGATSAALLRRFLGEVGARTIVYVPDRQREGYGPNEAALLALKARGASVVVTVDCGITAFAPLAAAADAGVDVIVVDHHVAEPALPPALAIVNPNRLDEAGGYGMLAAVGVAFLLAVGVNRALRQAGWYATRPEPNLLDRLDLVALGTICDVVPLSGINRAFVAQGLKVLRRRATAGLVALADVAGIDERLDAYHAGFVLGPRINAGGRVGESDLGARLLSSDDPLEVKQLAVHLDALNRERREIEARVLAAAIEQVEHEARGGPLVFVGREGWHPGVIGIVASRLRERYNRPACVYALESGVAKGSGRSVPGVALGPAIIAARQAGLLISGGGHAMAAGFTVAANRVDDLRLFLEARMENAADGPPVPELAIDGSLSPEAVSPDLVATVERLGPFGTGNSEPRFAIAHARLLRADPVGAGLHLSCVLGDAAGGHRVKAIKFRAFETPLGQALLAARGGILHVAGHLRADRWNGNDGVQLMIDDAASA